VKKTKVDLIVGGSILLALFILIAGVLWLKEVSVTRKLVSYAVLFPNVGTLSEGDPVMVNGVTKGSVASITLRGTKVAAIIQIDKDVAFTDSSIVTVQNIGLMGERGIGIQLSEKGSRCKVTKKGDTTFISGKFDTGIAEAMGMMGTVLGEVEILTGSVASIVDQTVGDSAFLTSFETMVQRLDTLTGIAQSIIVKNQPLLDQSIRDISVASAELKDLMQENRHRMDSIIVNGEKLSSYSIAVAQQVQTLVGSVQNIVSQVENGEGSLGMLMKDEQFYHDIKKTVADLDTLVNDIKDDALKLRIKLGFGKKKQK